jgi:hypothetical protein
MSDSSDNEDEYVAKINSDVAHWIDELASKGIRGFKLPECKEKFMVIPINRLSDACEYLVKRKQIELDPSSRRIAAYTIHPDVVTSMEKKKAAAERAEAQEIEKAKAARANAMEAAAARAAQVKEAQETKALEAERAQKRAEQDLKKSKAAAAAAAPLAKKQKVDDALGTRKISSFFQVQGALNSLLAAHVPSSKPSSSAASDENTAPIQKSTSSANMATMHSSEDSDDESPMPVKKPITQAPVVQQFKIVDLLPSPVPQKAAEKTSSSSGSGEGAASAGLQDLIMQLIPEAFLSNGGSVDVHSLLRRCVAEHTALHPCAAPLEEVHMQEVLRTLESRNVIMIDDGVIYEV